MGSRIWEQKMISGLAAIALLGLLALPVFAGDTIPVKAVLVTDCGSGCQTDAGGWSLIDQTWIWNGSGTYSLLPDLYGEYFGSILAAPPRSVYVAEGSAVAVGFGRRVS